MDLVGAEETPLDLLPTPPAASQLGQEGLEVEVSVVRVEDERFVEVREQRTDLTSGEAAQQRHVSTPDGGRHLTRRPLASTLGWGRWSHLLLMLLLRVLGFHPFLRSRDGVFLAKTV